MKIEGLYELLYNHLQERPDENIRELLQKKKEYQDAAKLETEYEDAFNNLDLTNHEHNIIETWTDAIHVKYAIYAEEMFEIGMKCCFALLLSLYEKDLTKEESI